MVPLVYFDVAVCALEAVRLEDSQEVVFGFCFWTVVAEEVVVLARYLASTRQLVHEMSELLDVALGPELLEVWPLSSRLAAWPSAPVLD